MCFKIVNKIDVVVHFFETNMSSFRTWYAVIMSKISDKTDKFLLNYSCFGVHFLLGHSVCKCISIVSPLHFPRTNPHWFWTFSLPFPSIQQQYHCSSGGISWFRHFDAQETECESRPTFVGRGRLCRPTFVCHVFRLKKLLVSKVTCFVSVAYRLLW